MEKILLGISSCLLGNNVRYDGQHKRNEYITDILSKYFDWLAVCPEVEYGLSIPREPMRLVNIANEVRLITTKSKIDHTDGLLLWSKNKVKELASIEISGYIFKSKSPSSAIFDAKIYNEYGTPIKKGAGIFGAVFLKNFPYLPVIDDGKLYDRQLRTNFFNKVYCYKRWQTFIKTDASISGLINFHKRHKLLIMSHSLKHYSLLGKLVANQKGVKNFLEEYFKLFMESLSFKATVKKHINVLMHCIGYFKKFLTHDEKKEFQEILENYRIGNYPLCVPLVLIKHYTNKYNITYLKEQYYLDPLPLELTI